MGIKKNKGAKKMVKNEEKDDGLGFALKALGYLLPETEEEIEAYEKIHGNTEIDLPDHLKVPNFLFEEKTTKQSAKKSSKKIETKSVKSTEISSPLKVVKSENDYFKKVVLAAEIANQLHQEPTFGHKKFVKVLYLCKEVCSMKLSTNYGRYAAGPLDPKLMYSIDSEFKKQKWFKVTKGEYGYRYELDQNIEKYKSYYTKYFYNHLENINSLISLFKKEKSDFCEIVATLYFLWKNDIDKKNLISDNGLIKGFYAWDESKKRFKEQTILDVIRWMEEKEIVPQ